MPVFATPLVLLGLVSLPALAAIYYFHARSRLLPVSSLLLWTDAKVAPVGGRRVDQLRLPPVFWLELLLLALLVLAAVGIHIPAPSSARPLIVVLDDSFSMQAGAPDSPRTRAAEALLEDLRHIPRHSVRFILAGERPQALGQSVSRTTEVEKLLEEGWTCQSNTSRLDSAIALALEVGGDSASVLVLTDQAPATPPESGRVRWWSVGSATPNWAIVNASRASGPRGDRILLEVSNLASESRATTLKLETTGTPPTELKSQELQLNAGETQRLVLEVPTGTGSVRASLGDDSLNFDNVASLISTTPQLVSYEVKLSDKDLQASLERALKATGLATPAAQPQLVFVDGDAPAPESEQAWVVRVYREEDADAFTGPFVLDRAHPLTDGLSLNDVVWGGGKTPLPGTPVVMAGNVMLLTDSESPGGRHELRLRLRPDLSTLLKSPAWPALMWNFAHWRASFRPGLDRVNVRLGEEAVWTLSESTSSAKVTRPGGEVSTVPVHARRVAVRAERSGIYSLSAGEEKAEFAANALNHDESDLTKSVTGRWGEEHDEATLRSDYRDITMWLVLIAAAVATVHLWLLARSSGAGATP